MRPGVQPAGLVLDRTVRVLPGRPGSGAVLLGGTPMRLVRLSPRATRCLQERDWSSSTGTVLAGRLIDAGLAHPRHDPGGQDGPGGPGGPQQSEVTVVVPVRDRPGGLARLLASLDPGLTVVVVDDGSVAPVAGAGVRHPAPLGPAAARNAGLALVRTPLVAFLDSDCVPQPGWLAPLLAHLRDPQVGLVAPRVVGSPEPAESERPGPMLRRVHAYEQHRSPLDLGPHEQAVRPGGRVAYVPAAAMLARVAALGDGFDARLVVGEDVDLVWRLVAAGWRVRYEPASRVAHDHRTTLRSWARQRWSYGTSAAPLERAHPGEVPAVRLSPWTAGAWALAASLHPAGLLAGAAVTAAATARLARRLDVPEPWQVAARVVVGGTLASGHPLASALVRPWWPLTLPLLRYRRTRVVLVASVLARAAVDRGKADGPPPPGLPAWTLLHLADDVCYTAGVWAGCLRHRHLGALLPRAANRRPAGAARHRVGRSQEAPVTPRSADDVAPTTHPT